MVVSRSKMSGQGPVRSVSSNRASVRAVPSGSATTARSRSSTLPSGSLGSVAGRRGWQDLDARLLGVVFRLTERDRLLCSLLDDHRVLTIAQMTDVGFTDERFGVALRARSRTEVRFGRSIPAHFGLAARDDQSVPPG